VSGGKQYLFSVACYNEIGGESKKSNTVEVTPSIAPIGMHAPVEVTHDIDSITV